MYRRPLNPPNIPAIESDQRYIAVALVVLLLGSAAGGAAVAGPTPGSGALAADGRIGPADTTPSPIAPAGGAVAAANATVERVTLVTGQTVTAIERNGTTRYRVPEGASLHRMETDQGTYFVPEGVDFERFSPNLFNVDLLRAQNLTDSESDSLPVIVQRAERDGANVPGVDTGHAGARDRLDEMLGDVAGTTGTRTLESIDAVAADVRKSEARAAYESLRADESVERVSLDVRYRLALDETAELVNATAADRRRYGANGSGVNISIIDTGIDESHPDIDQVADEQDFTPAQNVSVDDYVGHGTHVAGIVAGDGTASNGTYTGVAPNATVIDAKALTAVGGRTSWIIQAMNYSVAQDADVISMSLGGPAESVRSNDPFSEAVNRTVSKNVSVVVAAGNSGPDYGTVGSPGITRRAITVAASDKTGGVADFSSRGPTPAGHFLKPDVAAPGASVVSALSGDSQFLSPVDGNDRYTRLNGTSMATPAVSGVVALVRQKHPSWEPTRVKSVVGSTATDLSGVGPYAEGAGRVNASAAVDPDYVVGPSTVDFGTVSANETIRKTVTLTNLGDDNESLNLSVGVARLNQTSSMAPVAADNESDDAATWVNDSTLTLGPNGQAQVEIVLDASTRVGVYGGRLFVTGNASDATVTSADRTAVFGFARAHEVTVEKQPLSSTSVSNDPVLLASTAGSVVSGATYKFGDIDSGTATFEVLASGNYTAVSPGANEGNGQPIVTADGATVDGTTTLTLDESATVTHRLNVSGLEDAPFVNRSVEVEYGKDVGGYPVRGSTVVSFPDTREVRIPTGTATSNVTAWTEYTLVPESEITSDERNASAFFDSPVVYQVLNGTENVTRDRTFPVPRESFAAHNVTYQRGTPEPGSTYNATLTAFSPLGSAAAVSGNIGDRRRQTVLVSGAEYHAVGAESPQSANED
jgi:subtilisin family serine protease